MRYRDENPRFRDVVVRGLVVLHATDKAILVIEKDTLDACQANGDTTTPFKKWVPRSQVRRCSEPLHLVCKDDTIDLTLPKWLAEEKEFMYEE